MNTDEIPLQYIKAYRKALRDVVDWLERHEQQMKAYKLTTGKDYMAFLRMFRDAPDNWKWVALQMDIEYLMNVRIK